MKVLVVGILLICFTGNVTTIYSESREEYIKASECLGRKGEVYFTFNITSRSDVNELTRIISVDNIVDKKIYAYANIKEFTQFLTYNLPYEVLPHPGDLLQNPKMSDYKDRKEREWDAYPTYDGYVAMMAQFEIDYPGLCKIVDIGESVNGRKLLCARISDNVNTEEAEPKFFYTSSIHGDEITGYVLMLRLIDTLVSSYATSPRIKHLVDNMEIWINPLSNPDGTYQSDNSTVAGARRYNANNVDLNRNFPYVYSERFNQILIESETQALIDFGNDYKFVLSADMHGGTELAYYPWNHSRTATADEAWFIHVCRQYADVAQANSPIGYFDDNGGVINGYDWYEVQGERIGYVLYYQQCRDIGIELSTIKVVTPDKLPDYWKYNYRSFLNYMEQCLYGLNGIVTDSITGIPLNAKVFVENHDLDNSHVYSNLPHGDYYRPIYEGVYDVTFSCDDYVPKTIENVSIANGLATKLDVELVPLGLHVSSPNGGEQWERGKTYSVTWSDTVTGSVRIELLKGGSPVDTLTNATQSDGLFSWSIPLDVIVGSDYRIRITSISDPAVYDVSEANFSIITPTITVTYPNGNHTLYGGSVVDILWTSGGTVGDVKILYSTNNGTDWYSVITSTSNDGNHLWIVPDVISSQCKIKISEAIDDDPFDESDATFAIEPAPSITVTSPNGTETLLSGITHTVTWTTIGSVGDVKIEYTTSDGSSWFTVVGSTPNDGTLPWIIPGGIVSSNCRIRISEASDNNPVDESDAVFTIEPTPAITVASPNGGETFAANISLNITWTSVGTVGEVKILFSPDNGSNWYTVVASTANDGTHPWIVPDSVSTGCIIQISEATDNDPIDESDAVFIIEPAPVITVTSPDGSENWVAGFQHDITWTTIGTVGNVKIEYSIDDGTNWLEVVASTANDGIHPWTVPDAPSANCKIRICEASDGSPFDESNVVFTIKPAPSLTVLTPNGGEIIILGSSYDITWSSNGTVSDVKIEYTIDNGSSWVSVAATTANDGAHTWSVPSMVSTSVKVRISETIDNDPFDESDAVFTIDNLAETIDEPDLNNSGEVFVVVPNPVSSNQKAFFQITPKQAITGGLLKVYDPVGNTVYETDVPDCKANGHCVIGSWDLRNTERRMVGSGTYIAVLVITESYGRTNIYKTAIGVKEE